MVLCQLGFFRVTGEGDGESWGKCWVDDMGWRVADGLFRAWDYGREQGMAGQFGERMKLIWQGNEAYR